MKKYSASKKMPAALFVLFMLFATFFSVPVSAAYGPNADPAPSGAYLEFKVTFKNDPSGLAYTYENLKTINYVIEEGDMLEYDVRFDYELDGIGSVDGTIPGVPYDVLRGLNQGAAAMTDQNDITVHTLADLSDYAYDRWYHRVLNLGITEEESGESETATVGKTFRIFQLGVHPQNMSEEHNNLTVTILYDNIVITNNGAVKLVIFQNADDIDMFAVKHAFDNGFASSSVELKSFTDEMIQEYTVEAASREQASIEASEEASRKKESQEQSREEASIKASEEEEASRQASESEAKASLEAAEAESASESGSKTWVLIGCVSGVIVIAIVIVVIFTSRSKKKA